MDNLRKNLITAFQEGNFLKVVYDKSSREPGNCSDLVDELVSMNNDGLLDVIACFRDLENNPDKSYKFFQTRHLFEKTLPRINAPVKQVMDCVLLLFKAAGKNMAVGKTFDSFIDFCAAEPSRPKESLNQIEKSFDKLADLLIPTVVAGARIDAKHFLDEAIRLTEHENIDIRKRAILSLGRIQYPQSTNLCEYALACLELSGTKEIDDHLLGNIIKSAFSFI